MTQRNYMDDQFCEVKWFKDAQFRMPFSTTLAAGAIFCAGMDAAMAEDNTAPAATPPAYTVLRYDEDYSYLKDPAARTNTFDAVKYIPLDGWTNSYVTLGGQVRDRYEYFENFQFGSAAQNGNGYNLLRVMGNADFHFGPNFRVFIQGISATEQGRIGGPRASDEDEFDLHQGFAELDLPLAKDVSLGVRAGRQIIIFGAQRLIGVSDFTNVRRTYDGVRGTLTTPGNTLDGFYARPVAILPYEFDNDVHNTYITGVYDTWSIPGALAKAKTKLDMYLFYVNRNAITYNQTTSGENRYTFGTRLYATPKPFDYDLEMDYQVGRFHEQATHSFSVAAIGGYTLESALFKPRVFLGSDIASGGRTNHIGDTFDQLFPSGHDQFGIIDALGRQNIIDIHPGVTLTLLENRPGVQQLTMLTQYRQFWRESNEDASYTSSATILRPSSARSTSSSIGGEVDVQLNWQINRNFSAYMGYCHFFHGSFIAETGPNPDIDFAYSALTFTF
ncbi:MAG: hypothetical protein JWR26_247 [Pedosphaera sp.]|nr:hypothetical protein [Pedosphaera sp.]